MQLSPHPNDIRVRSVHMSVLRNWFFFESLLYVILLVLGLGLWESTLVVFLRVALCLTARRTVDPPAINQQLVPRLTTSSAG
jgi:hypothetical protein